MFILVYCNENSIFQTLNKYIAVVLQWLNQSTGSASRREFIQYVCVSALPRAKHSKGVLLRRRNLLVTPGEQT